MNLKICPCCKVMQTTKNAKKVGSDIFDGKKIIYFNCNCTFVIVGKDKDERLLRSIK